MKLAYWMYSGPAHIGTLRIATSFKKVHAIMHAPIGDDYFNVMRSMLERKRNFTPVTTSVVDRHVLAQGSKEKVIQNIQRKDIETQPDLIILTPTCTSSILQEDLENFVSRSNLVTKSDVLLADVNHYRVNELEAADKTLKQVVEFYLQKENLPLKKTKKPSVNIIGAYNLGFHNQHDITELKRLFFELGININLIIPENISVYDLKKLPKAWFNFVPYREIGLLTAKYLKEKFDMPFVSATPMGVTGISECLLEIQKTLEELNFFVNFDSFIDTQTRFLCQSAWFSQSIDCQNLIGKTAIVFGDATHAAYFTKILSQEMGINVIMCGTYCSSDEAWFRTKVEPFCKNILITNDQNLVAEKIQKLSPSAIFGTQMERHIGKKLNIPCGVISAPVHIQNFPLSYKPFLGYEGANQIADLIYNSFTLGMEDHLLELFGGHDTKKAFIYSSEKNQDVEWSEEAQIQLKRIPGFVREKIRKKVEDFAISKKIQVITSDIIYQAKENKEVQNV